VFVVSFFYFKINPFELNEDEWFENVKLLVIALEFDGKRAMNNTIKIPKM